MRPTTLSLILAALAAVIPPPAAVSAAPAKDHREAVERAVAYLQTRQNADGSIADPEMAAMPGTTALAVYAMARSHLKLRADDPALSKAVAFILQHVQEDGSIYNPKLGLPNYNTALSAMALIALEDPKHKPVVEKALSFTRGHQMKEGAMQGAIGYGGKGPGNGDLSNTKTAAEFLHEAGISEDDPLWKDLLVFVARCQNNGETNDLEKLPKMEAFIVSPDPADAGGFRYGPTESKAPMTDTPEGKKIMPSYGSMTYAGLLSFLYAGVGKDDPKVQGAVNWIKNHWTLDENPGLRGGREEKFGQQGLFYYYYTFAKAMAAYGEKEIETADGKNHDWAAELIAKLISIQREDGSFVNAQSERWDEDSPALVTSYAVMALNVAGGTRAPEGIPDAAPTAEDKPSTP